LRKLIKDCITFTSNLADQYALAKKENDNHGLPYYVCANSNGPTHRRLELSSRSVFCKKDRNEQQDGEEKNYLEYLLQAYMVRKAQINDFSIIKGLKDWKLLDAERKFHNIEIIEGEKTPSRMDFLAYSESEQSYIILELKNARKNKNGRPIVFRDFAKAKRELRAYRRYLYDEILGADYVYEKQNPAGNDIKCYIVWPYCKNGRSNDLLTVDDQNGSYKPGIIEVVNLDGMTNANAEEHLAQDKLKFVITRDFEKC